ncbi:MAG TPA: glycosyltransferase family 39 protein [Rhizomicrobium sp.]|jgi:4-amino-4-deoxy-L-arabinose transferase-like glycosyltransferase
MAEATLVLSKPVPSWLERAGRRPILVIMVLVVVGWLPAALMLPPLDRDESRFAEASRQMVETGNYIDIRFAQSSRYKKPVGIYWLQAASAKLLGPLWQRSIWPYRLPSFVGGILSLLILYGIARSIAPPRTALLAPLLLGSTLLLAAESDIATTDAALLACVVAVQAVLLRVYLSARGREAPSRALVFGGWAALGMGVLLKGPVILAVAGVTVLAVSLWDRDWRWLRGTRPATGLALAIVIVAPWAIAIGFASHGAFYQQSLGHDFAAKILGGEESHGAPPGYYLALATATFWPASLLLLPALGSAISNRGDPAVRYLLAWSGAVWLLFELVPTKLPHYVLPAYPALALLAALWAGRPQSQAESRGAAILRVASCALFAIATIAMTAACIELPRRFGGTVGWPLPAGAALALGAALAAVILLLRRRPELAASFGIVSALVLYLLLAFAVVPQLDALWLSPRAAELIASHRRAGDPPVVLDGYLEPSLVFLLGSDTRIESRNTAGAASASSGGLALVEDRVRPLFLTDVRRAGSAATPEGSIVGFDYSTGREQHITLYRVTRGARS